MKKLWQILKSCFFLLLIYLFFGSLVTVSILDANDKPLVYRSASTLEMVKVEIRGKEVSKEDWKKVGERYVLVWVK